jgi:hypothetical protein
VCSSDLIDLDGPEFVYDGGAVKAEQAKATLAPA